MTEFSTISAGRRQPVITVHLGGGLGNQLFQYAFGRRMSLANGARLVLDGSGYQSVRAPDPEFGVRMLGLDHFRIEGTLVRQAKDVRPAKSWLARKYRKYRGRALRLLDMTRPYYLRREVFEPEQNHFNFDARLYNRPITRDVDLFGYWQSQKYFADIEEKIRSELVVADELNGLNAQTANAIRKTNSISIHVRHGDNANRVARELGVLPSNYFDQAIARLLKEVTNAHFFVFSDDIPWAKQVIALDYPTTFVSHNGDARNYEDLRLMTFCKHHVLGNSTFSWWGAWLGKKDGQIVYAPRRYWQNINRPNPDLYPDHWRLI